MPTDGESTLALKDVPARLSYPIEEAAVLLGISETTARRRISSGDLLTIHDGGRRLVSREQLLTYHRSRKVAPPPAGKKRKPAEPQDH